MTTRHATGLEKTLLVGWGWVGEGRGGRGGGRGGRGGRGEGGRGGPCSISIIGNGNVSCYLIGHAAS